MYYKGKNMNKIYLSVIYFYYFCMFIYIEYIYHIPIEPIYIIPCLKIFIFTTGLIIITIAIIRFFYKKKVKT